MDWRWIGESTQTYAIKRSVGVEWYFSEVLNICSDLALMNRSRTSCVNSKGIVCVLD